MDEPAFLDLVYAAPLKPHLWETVLERLSDVVSGHAANLTRLHLHDPEAGSGITARVDPATMQRFMEHYALVNPLHTFDEPESYVRGWAPTVYRVREAIDWDSYRRTEYFNDFMRPIEADWSLVVRLDLRDRAVSTIMLGRPGPKGDFSQAEMDVLRRLQPHLIRAYRLTEQMADVNGRAEALSDALARTRQAMFLVDADGRVGWMNSAAQALLDGPDGLCAPNGRLTLAKAALAGQLGGLIARAAGASGQPRTGGSLTLPSPRRRRPLTVAVTPVGPEQTTLFTGSRSVLVCVSDPDAGRPSAAALRDAFGLTEAEARVALAVTDGLSVAETASRYGVSRNTVRVQLSSVFAKTGAHRQTDLVRLLAEATGRDA